MSFHNTTHEEGQYLLCLEFKAKALEERVYQVFLSENRPMVWSEVHSLLPEANEVSLKRAITNLKTTQKLVKTTEKGMTKYDVPAYKYKLAS